MFNDNVDVKATHFCKACKDPEPLCESCAKQHMYPYYLKCKGIKTKG